MSNRNTTPKRDLHAEITANLIKAIESDPGKPQMPWRRSGRPLWIPESASSKTAYNGINTINLWVAAELRGFTSPLWATYRQWSELGAQVVKGAKSELVIFYKEYDVDPDPESADDDGKRRIAKASRVFNVAEVEGFDDPGLPERLGPIAPIEKADRFIATCNANVQHGGERAYYAPQTDNIQMPDEAMFCGTDTMTRDEGYYAVLLHELTHYADVRIMPRRSAILMTGARMRRGMSA
jgi:antirestriction protein ArdC